MDQPGTDPVATAKVAMRDQLGTARRRLPPARLREDADRLADVLLASPEVRRAATVAAYVSVASEPGTGLLLDRLVEQGRQVLLPVVLPDLDLDWARYTGSADLVTARRGLLEPAGPRLGVNAVAWADVVLVPATAVDRAGRRLGQGGGCYDRALARVPVGTPLVALLHEGELVGRVPAAPHDRPVTAAATPSRMVRLGREAV